MSAGRALFATSLSGSHLGCRRYLGVVYGGRSKDSRRLTAAGQVLRPDGSFRRNLPFEDLRGDRPLYLQQRPLNSDGPDERPNDSSPPRRSALRDPKESVAVQRAGVPHSC